MPVSVNMPTLRQEKQERPQEDPMDKILKGLNIAASVYGLKDAYDKGQALKQQQEADDNTSQQEGATNINTPEVV